MKRFLLGFVGRSCGCSYSLQVAVVAGGGNGRIVGLDGWMDGCWGVEVTCSVVDGGTV